MTYGGIERILSSIFSDRPVISYYRNFQVTGELRGELPGNPVLYARRAQCCFSVMCMGAGCLWASTPILRPWPSQWCVYLWWKYKLSRRLA